MIRWVPDVRLWEKGWGKGSGLLDNDNEAKHPRSLLHCTQRQSLGHHGVPARLGKASIPTSTGPAGSVISLKDLRGGHD